MKKYQFLSIAVTVIVFSACNDSDNSGTKTDTLVTQHTVTTTTSHRVLKPEEVATPVTTTFTQTYPKAENIEWTRYSIEEPQPIDFDWELTGWPMPDTLDYIAKFNMDNSDYWSWYDYSGDWIGTVTSINTSGLPDAVDARVKSDFPGYTIISVNKEFDKKRTAYEIKMERGEDKMKALIDEAGIVIKKKGKEEDVKVKEKNK